VFPCYPHLVETATVVAEGGFESSGEFETGLDLSIDGLGRWRGNV
jgi:hypothetical protein